MSAQFPAARFVYVYVAEAHARDEWPLGSVECADQPTTLDERLARARHFRDAYGVAERIPVVVDKMDNAFDAAYAVWPERFFIVQRRPQGGGREGEPALALVGQPATEFGYERGDLQHWLGGQQLLELGKAARKRRIAAVQAAALRNPLYDPHQQGPTRGVPARPDMQRARTVPAGPTTAAGGPPLPPPRPALARARSTGGGGSGGRQDPKWHDVPLL